VYGSSTLAHRIKLFRALYQFHVPCDTIVAILMHFHFHFMQHAVINISSQFFLDAFCYGLHLRAYRADLFFEFSWTQLLHSIQVHAIHFVQVIMREGISPFHPCPPAIFAAA
jgi:hypothetical protein